MGGTVGRTQGGERAGSKVVKSSTQRPESGCGIAMSPLDRDANGYETGAAQKSQWLDGCSKLSE